eukprot:8469429-Lingulodinium_polyedra.AAC.1
MVDVGVHESACNGLYNRFPGNLLGSIAVATPSSRVESTTNALVESTVGLLMGSTMVSIAGV